MSDPSPRPDAVTAVTAALEEVLDVVQDVKQASRKVPASHPLHGELDRLMVDVRRWAQLLVDEDEALGTWPVSRVPTAAGRRPPNLWPGDAPDEDVRRTVAAHLQRLSDGVAAGLAGQDDPGVRDVLLGIGRDVAAHRGELDRLAAPPDPTGVP